MKVLYELGRLASKQPLNMALPDPDGLRQLIDGLYAEIDSKGHAKLTPAGEDLARTALKSIEVWI